MVRESIARHLGPGQTATVRPWHRSDDIEQHGGAKADTTHESGWTSHASHLRLPLVSGDEDGACLIEPSVRCNHCGYCLSLGH
jgi:hypothetical protein